MEVFPYAEESVVEPGTPEEEIEDPEPEELLVVRLPAGLARAFSKRAQAVVVGRPAAVPVLRRPARPGRTPLPAGQRLPPHRRSDARR